MTIPDYQTVMLPLLRLAGDGQEHSVREAIETLADNFDLSEDERKELLPSGGQATFDNRVGWARTYMKKAGLLESPRRGFFRITTRGRKALAENPKALNAKFLERYPEFLEFKTKSRAKDDTDGTVGTGAIESTQSTPLEAIEGAYHTIRTQLADELLEQVMQSSPQFFEQLVVDLLVKMGYGGSRKDAGEAIGRSGDEGIDGIMHHKRGSSGLGGCLYPGEALEGHCGQPRNSSVCRGTQWSECEEGGRHHHFHLLKGSR
jgi:restriction system protein